MPEFRLHRSSNVDEAVAVHSRGIRASYLAGGQSLIPSLVMEGKGNTLG